VDIIEIAGFMKNKEALMHIITQKYHFDIYELMKY
jgi:hypothetical protein